VIFAETIMEINGHYSICKMKTLPYSLVCINKIILSKLMVLSTLSIWL
jgi:hypothetical protein